MPSSDYYMDLRKFSLEKLKDLFNNTRMLPSQQILQEDVDDRFACLGRHGIENYSNCKQRSNQSATCSPLQRLRGCRSIT